MADVEVNGIGVVLHGVDDAGEEYDEVSSQKAGGKGIEDAVAVHQVDIGALLDTQLLAAVYVALIEVRELLLVQFHAIALDPGNQGGLGEKVGDKEKAQVQQ